MLERIEAFTLIDKTEPIEAAWHELQAAEAAINALPFPEIPSPVTSELRPALTAGLKRKHRYTDALRSLNKRVEEAFGERFIAVQPGDWLNNRGAAADIQEFVSDDETDQQAEPLSHYDVIGKVLYLSGTSLWVYNPRHGTVLPNDTLHGYPIGSRRTFSLCDCPIDSLFNVPGYYWLHHAYKHLKSCEMISLYGLRALFDTISCTAKAWWASFLPSDEKFGWAYDAGDNIVNLKGKAPESVATPLINSLELYETLLRLTPGGLPNPSDTGTENLLKSALNLIETAMITLKTLIGSRIDYDNDDWISLHGLPTRIKSRNGSQLLLVSGYGETYKIDFFDDTVYRIAKASTPATHPDGLTKPFSYQLTDMIEDWEDSIEEISQCIGWENFQIAESDITVRKHIDSYIQLLGGQQVLSYRQRDRLNKADQDFRESTGLHWSNVK